MQIAKKNAIVKTNKTITVPLQLILGMIIPTREGINDSTAHLSSPTAVYVYQSVLRVLCLTSTQKNAKQRPYISINEIGHADSLTVVLCLSSFIVST